MTTQARDRRHGEDGARDRRARAGARLGRRRALDRAETDDAASRSDAARRRRRRVEFTTPDAAPANIRARRRRPAVPSSSERRAGTTSSTSVAPEVRAARRRAAHGAELLARREHLRADRRATRRDCSRSAPGFDAHIVETHHAAKKDAPSGTAATLGAHASSGVRTRRFRSRAFAPDPFRARTSSSSTRRSSRFVSSTSRATGACSPRARSSPRRGSSASAACSRCATC